MSIVFKLGSFDAIIVDIYCGNEFPSLGNTGTFFSSLKRLLSNNGLVIFNRISFDTHLEVDSFYDHVKANFRDAKTKPVAGYTNSDNILIYAKV